MATPEEKRDFTVAHVHVGQIMKNFPVLIKSTKVDSAFRKLVTELQEAFEDLREESCSFDLVQKVPGKDDTPFPICGDAALVMAVERALQENKELHLFVQNIDNKPPPFSAADIIDSELENVDKAELVQYCGEDNLLMNEIGVARLRYVVDTYRARLRTDPTLSDLHFFDTESDGTKNVQVVNDKEFNFMKWAFAVIPVNVDVPTTVLEDHARLFQLGLNEDHFDIALHHFLRSLEDHNVMGELIVEASERLVPLRKVFENAAREQEHYEATQRSSSRRGSWASLAVVTAVAAIGFAWQYATHAGMEGSK